MSYKKLAIILYLITVATAALPAVTGNLSISQNSSGLTAISSEIIFDAPVDFITFVNPFTNVTTTLNFSNAQVVYQAIPTSSFTAYEVDMDFGEYCMCPYGSQDNYDSTCVTPFNASAYSLPVYYFAADSHGCIASGTGSACIWLGAHEQYSYTVANGFSLNPIGMYVTVNDQPLYIDYNNVVTLGNFSLILASIDTDTNAVDDITVVTTPNGQFNLYPTTLVNGPGEQDSNLIGWYQGPSNFYSYFTANPVNCEVIDCDDPQFDCELTYSSLSDFTPLPSYLIAPFASAGNVGNQIQTATFITTLGGTYGFPSGTAASVQGITLWLNGQPQLMCDNGVGLTACAQNSNGYTNIAKYGVLQTTTGFVSVTTTGQIYAMPQSSIAGYVMAQTPDSYTLAITALNQVPTLFLSTTQPTLSNCYFLNGNTIFTVSAMPQQGKCIIETNTGYGLYMTVLITNQTIQIPQNVSWIQVNCLSHTAFCSVNFTSSGGYNGGSNANNGNSPVQADDASLPWRFLALWFLTNAISMGVMYWIDVFVIAANGWNTFLITKTSTLRIIFYFFLGNIFVVAMILLSTLSYVRRKISERRQRKAEANYQAMNSSLTEESKVELKEALVVENKTTETQQTSAPIPKPRRN